MNQLRVRNNVCGLDKQNQCHIDYKSAITHNAALSGEQRRPLHLKYCAVNNKAEANQKCRALGIRL
ncbi:hypothetical protein, partial [Vibrio parahaemolyticus]|uniref:hypothetical protein n=1 Tax=Vibrio parahaemolyticus TaxID=670 RepID=UPI0023609344